FMSRDLDVRVEGPAKIGLFVYDNGTFIVESFLDEPTQVTVVLSTPENSLTELTGNTVFKVQDHKCTFTLEPHTYKVFKK
ncbi:MAG TPA: hypothetical protein PLC77_02230, partial [Bacteroidales bacterium]|nr:hypothetical protein [Bacteroidales bacterium]